MSLSMLDILEARDRISGKINVTPVLSSSTLDAQAGNKLFFKCENFQKIGAFKARGAINAVFSLTDTECRNGVVTHSSGNHGAALAHAARLRGIPAYIVMPKDSRKAKLRAVALYGGQVILCEPTQESRENAAREVISETDAAFVHPYDDLRVMAGQGTLALELLEQAPDVDTILCPVSGGGLLSGIAVAAKALRPNIKIIGVEPENADDAARSFRAGALIKVSQPQTIADGLKSSLADSTFTEIRQYVDDIITVSEQSIIDSMRTIWDVMKIIVEPSASVPYAAILQRTLNTRGRNVAIIVTGGNLDLESLPW
jgi:threonine dehydratase